MQITRDLNDEYLIMSMISRHVFLPAKNGEVSYVIEMNVFMIGINFKLPPY